MFYLNPDDWSPRFGDDFFTIEMNHRRWVEPHLVNGTACGRAATKAEIKKRRNINGARGTSGSTSLENILASSSGGDLSDYDNVPSQRWCRPPSGPALYFEIKIKYGYFERIILRRYSQFKWLHSTISLSPPQPPTTTSRGSRTESSGETTASDGGAEHETSNGHTTKRRRSSNGPEERTQTIQPAPLLSIKNPYFITGCSWCFRFPRFCPSFCNPHQTQGRNTTLKKNAFLDRSESGNFYYHSVGKNSSSSKGPPREEQRQEVLKEFLDDLLSRPGYASDERVVQFLELDQLQRHKNYVLSHENIENNGERSVNTRICSASVSSKHSQSSMSRASGSFDNNIHRMHNNKTSPSAVTNFGTNVKLYETGCNEEN